MEPAPGADPGGHPIPRGGGRRSGRHALGAQDSNLKVTPVQGRMGLPFPLPPTGAAVRCRAEPPALQERGRSRARRRECPRSDSNAHWLVPQTSASAVGLRRHGAAIRCRPGSSAVRRRSRSRARRRGWPSWPRTRKLRVQSAAGLPNSPNGHRVRETRVERASGPF